ncbi:MAG: quinone-dependent dihydroorotate dehydrogenase [Bacteriovoracaceae bacterium]|nr:quinone-dependent dihydroorotate dehydrogenase [Bacteriovoracaceae bacterium]
MFYSLLKKILFQFDPEFIHHESLELFHAFPHFFSSFFHHHFKTDTQFLTHRRNPLKLVNPLIVAAGLDKNAVALPIWEAMGFGAVEVGTVTPLAQLGNAKPRIFRFKDETLLNSMGFPNLGMHAVASNIARFKKSQQGMMKVGINIGKNKNTSLENSINDYLQTYEYLSPLADYVAINISSPNTPGLRSLGNESWLRECLQELVHARKKNPKALFIKVGPDLAKLTDYDFLSRLTQEFDLAGIVATNTTSDHLYGSGGISGARLLNKSRMVREYLLKHFQQTCPEKIVMGVGGMSRPEHFQEFWNSGGVYAQLYSGLIYQGPGIIRKILHTFTMKTLGH